MASRVLVSFKHILIHLKFIMSSHPTPPDLHPLFNTRSRNLRETAIEQALTDIEDLCKSSLRTLLLKRMVLCKRKGSSEHEFIYCEVIDAEEAGWSGVAILERGRNGPPPTPVDTGDYELTTRGESTQGPVATATPEGLASTAAPNTPTSLPSPTPVRPQTAPIPTNPKIGMRDLLALSTSPLNSSLKSPADDKVTLGVPQAQLTVMLGTSHQLCVWEPETSAEDARLAPHLRQNAFLRVLAAATVVSRNAPKYELMYHQCFYFAGVLFALVAGRGKLRERIPAESVRIGTWKGLSITTIKDSERNADDLQAWYEDNYHELEGWADEARQQRENAEQQRVENEQNKTRAVDAEARAEQERQEREQAEARAEQEHRAREQERRAKEQAEARAEQERRAREQERRAREQERRAREQAEAEAEQTQARMAQLEKELEAMKRRYAEGVAGQSA